MVAPKVDGVRLKQALEEFGSLQKAVDTLKIQKRALEADVSALTKDRTNRLGEINHLDDTINEYKQNFGVHPYDWTERVRRVWRDTSLFC